jgi:hypothetical protein
MSSIVDSGGAQAKCTYTYSHNVTEQIFIYNGTFYPLWTLIRAVLVMDSLAPCSSVMLVSAQWDLKSFFIKKEQLTKRY